jgi:hypothetical protein
MDDVDMEKERPVTPVKLNKLDSISRSRDTSKMSAEFYAEYFKML